MPWKPTTPKPDLATRTEQMIIGLELLDEAGLDVPVISGHATNAIMNILVDQGVPAANTAAYTLYKLRQQAQSPAKVGFTSVLALQSRMTQAFSEAGDETPLAVRRGFAKQVQFGAAVEMTAKALTASVISRETTPVPELKIAHEFSTYAGEAAAATLRVMLSQAELESQVKVQALAKA